MSAVDALFDHPERAETWARSIPSIPVPARNGARTMNTKAQTREILVRVDEKVFRKNLEAARRARMTPSKYAALMVEGALALENEPERQPDLAKTVSGTLLLHGVGLDVDAVAKTLGVDETVVSTIVNRWQERRQAEAAAA